MRVWENSPAQTEAAWALVDIFLSSFLETNTMWNCEMLLAPFLLRAWHASRSLHVNYPIARILLSLRNPRFCVPGNGDFVKWKCGRPVKMSATSPRQMVEQIALCGVPSRKKMGHGVVIISVAALQWRLCWQSERMLWTGLEGHRCAILCFVKVVERVRKSKLLNWNKGIFTQRKRFSYNNRNTRDPWMGWLWTRNGVCILIWKSWFLLSMRFLNSLFFNS